MNISKKVALIGLGAFVLLGCESYQSRQKIKTLEIKLASLQSGISQSVEIGNDFIRYGAVSSLTDDFNNDKLNDFGFAYYDESNRGGLKIGFKIFNRKDGRGVEFSHQSAEKFKSAQLKSEDVNGDGRKDLILYSLDHQENPQTHHLINGKGYLLEFKKVS